MAELRERAVDPLDGLEELHRPWIDGIRIRTRRRRDRRARARGRRLLARRGHRAVLDAGLAQRRSERRGLRDGAGEGLTRADLPDHAYWEKWFPADWVTEMREQIRLWFYSQLFMSVVLDGRAPYQPVLAYEKLNDETGRPMHKCWGNAIWFDDAVEKMGADVMRWLYAAPDAVAEHELRLRARERGQEAPADAVEQLQLLRRLRGDRGLPPDVRATSSRARRPPRRSIASWWPASTRRRRAAARRSTATGRRAYVATVEALVDDLSNWYIRGSRAALLAQRRRTPTRTPAFRTLWYALVQVARLIAPAMPFLADELWQNLVARHCADAPDSVHLAGFPERDERLHDAAALAAMRDAQAVIAPGPQGALGGQPSSCASRWPRPSSSPRNARARASIEQHSRGDRAPS